VKRRGRRKRRCRRQNPGESSIQSEPPGLTRAAWGCLETFRHRLPGFDFFPIALWWRCNPVGREQLLQTHVGEIELGGEIAHGRGPGEGSQVVRHRENVIRIKVAPHLRTSRSTWRLRTNAKLRTNRLDYEADGWRHHKCRYHAAPSSAVKAVYD